MKRFLVLAFSIAMIFALASCTVRVKEDIFNVKDYGEMNSEGIQKTIDACTEGGVVYIPEGTYPVISPIKLKSNITLRGDFEKTILFVDKKLAELNKDLPVMSNSDFPMEKDVYGNTNIIIENLIFDGDRREDRSSNLLYLLKAKDVKIRNCTFKNNQTISVAIGGCKNITVSNCLLENNGLPKPSKISTPAIWTGFSYNNYPENIVIEDSVFQNNNWSGCYFMPHGGKITRCKFINNGESSIFTNGTARNIEYSYNFIKGATKSNISCNGIETGAQGVLIEGNLIEKCGGEGISLTNLKDAVVRNNMILNNGIEKVDLRCGIYIYTLSLDETECTPHNILIENNKIGNLFRGRVVQDCGVGFINNGLGEPIYNLTIRNNLFTKVRHGMTYSFSAEEITLGGNCNFEQNEYGNITQEERDAFLQELNERCEKVNNN